MLAVDVSPTFRSIRSSIFLKSSPTNRRRGNDGQQRRKTGIALSNPKKAMAYLEEADASKKKALRVSVTCPKGKRQARHGVQRNT